MQKTFIASLLLLSMLTEYHYDIDSDMSMVSKILL